MNHYRSVWLALLAALLVVLAPGCKKKAQTGNSVVKGRVTYKGSPVKFGMVQFWGRGTSDKGEVPTMVGSGGQLGEDGAYEVTGVPDGNYRVCVVTSMEEARKQMIPSGGGMGGGPGMGGGGPGMGGGGPGMGGGGPGMGGGGPGMGGGGPGMGGGGPGMPNMPDPMSRFTDADKKILAAVQAKYGTLMTTPLDFTVTAGEQTHDFNLE